MAKRKFRLKQARLSGDTRWMGFDFRAHIDAPDGRFVLSDPIISRVCGDEIDYGPLFVYCFRRFGYPQVGWDNYKQLARYVLTTPHPELLLCVVPYVGNTACITMEFLVTHERYHAIHAYDWRDRDAWTRRSLDWAEARGLPDWMDEWVGIYNTEFRKAFVHAPKAESWRGAVDFRFALGREGTRPYQLTDRVAHFRRQLHEDYQQIEPWPGIYERPEDPAAWHDDDPLKPLAEAAIVALEDLRAPVGVRDCQINAYGNVEARRRELQPAASAGYPCGALGNEAPEAFAELHGLIMKLGNGSARRGISKVLKAWHPSLGHMRLFPTTSW